MVGGDCAGVGLLAVRLTQPWMRRALVVGLVVRVVVVLLWVVAWVWVTMVVYIFNRGHARSRFEVAKRDQTWPNVT